MQSKDNQFYVTTPIYYVNSRPHVGTTYTTVLTDVAVRHARFMGQRALLVTGSDEHSQNIADLAAEAGVTPLEFCDRFIPIFQDCWKLVNIQDYRFERTSGARHKHVVQTFWQRIFDNGDVYKGEYSGWYHTSDNRFLDPEEVPEDPQNNPRLKHLTEETYYFRLSKYEDWLLKFHEANPQYIIPDFRRNEMLNRIRGGLKDISISRTSTDWGVLLPWDSGHVFYVWVDALLTYLTASGFDIDAFEKTFIGRSTEVREPLWETERGDLVTQPATNSWPADLHVMAKDIPWFHSVIWPAMLASYGAPLPKQMLVHGYWNFGGEKMSKSLGNVVDPYDAVKLVGVDGLRYFLMREVPVGLDGNFTHESLISRYNYDLANDLGNLVHRTVSMLHQLFDGVVPEALALTESDAEIEVHRSGAIGPVLEDYSELRYSEALQRIWALVGEANKYIDEKKPWELKKNPERRDEVSTVFNRLLNLIRTVLLLAYPVIPDATNHFWRLLNLDGTLEEQNRDSLGGSIAAGHRVNPSEPYFKRIDLKEMLGEDAAPEPAKPAKAAAQSHAAAASPAGSDAAGEGLIDIGDFAKVELRVAQVKFAERVENTDKLLRVILDDGERERQVLAGIAQHYDPAELSGKRVILVANLKPRQLRGLLSEGMLLAASDASGKLALLSPETDIAPGGQVR